MISHLSEVIAKSATSHKEAVKKTLHHLGISPLEAEHFEGTNFAADIENRQSMSRFLFKLNNTCNKASSSLYSLVLP